MYNTYKKLLNITYSQKNAHHNNVYFQKQIIVTQPDDPDALSTMKSHSEVTSYLMSLGPLFVNMTKNPKVS